MELLVFVRQYFNGDSAKQGHYLDTDRPFIEASISNDFSRSPAQQIKALASLDDKYNRRSRPGDICERHGDGWWMVNCLGRTSRMPDCYSCISIPGDLPKYLIDPELDTNDRFIYGHRYRTVVVPTNGTIEHRARDAAGIYDKVTDKLIVLQAEVLSG